MGQPRGSETGRTSETSGTGYASGMPGGDLRHANQD